MGLRVKKIVDTDIIENDASDDTQSKERGKKKVANNTERLSKARHGKQSIV